jgi:phosphoribosyl-ATP pyrophosphohydrolase/phosphoribosyl-AMP cyclohydrolase
VTFFSRTRQTLWTKGETSGHHIELVELAADCDRDTLLVRGRPAGPVCHLGTDSCFGVTAPPLAFLSELETIVRDRLETHPEGSYTAELVRAGRQRIAQKIGEEGVELALAAASGDNEQVIDEAADLLYHSTVMLAERGLSLSNVVARLAARHGD